MNKKNTNKQMILIGIMVFLGAVSLSGCIDEQDNPVEGDNQNQQYDDDILNNDQKDLEESSDNSNNNSETGDDLDKFIGTWTGNMEITQSGPRGSMIIDITKLTFKDENHVDAAETSSQKGSRITIYSYELDGSTLILDGERGSLSFVYSFNKDYNVLYLDGSEFIKSS